MKTEAEIKGELIRQYEMLTHASLFTSGVDIIRLKIEILKWVLE